MIKLQIGKAEAILAAVATLAVAISKYSAFSSQLMLPDELSTIPQFLSTAGLLIAILSVFQFSERVIAWSPLVRTLSVIIAFILGVTFATNFTKTLQEGSFYAECDRDIFEMVVEPIEPSPRLKNQAIALEGFGKAWCEKSGRAEFRSQLAKESAGALYMLSIKLIIAEVLLGFALGFALLGTVLKREN